MEKPKEFVRHVVLDMSVLALISGVVGWLAVDWQSGISVAIGCIWVATNFLLLSWLIGMVVALKQAPKLFIFLVACAKLPASYFLLWWLYQITHFEPLGITIGICLLPPVLLARGLISIKGEGKHRTNFEEGK